MSAELQEAPVQLPGFRILLSSLLVLLLACGGSGEGVLTVSVYGEAFIEEGIPASETDGWSVTFERFAVVLRDVKVGDREVVVTYPIDLTKPSDGAGYTMGSGPVPSGEYTDASFTIARIELEGAATKGEETKTFNWVFDEAVHYSDCDTTTVVPDGGSATFQITIHADHLLYDSLVSETPGLVFQGIADADADGDGEITREELSVADLGAYDPGSEGDIDNLWDYLAAQAASVGHADGEGHCTAGPPADD